MSTLKVTRHAIERYCERVSDVSNAVAKSALLSPALHTAAAVGAPFVRLPTGQRIVVRDRTIVTVLPSETPHRYLCRKNRTPGASRV